MSSATWYFCSLTCNGLGAESVDFLATIDGSFKSVFAISRVSYSFNTATFGVNVEDVVAMPSQSRAPEVGIDI